MESTSQQAKTLSCLQRLQDYMIRVQKKVLFSCVPQCLQLQHHVPSMSTCTLSEKGEEIVPQEQLQCHPSAGINTAEKVQLDKASVIYLHTSIRSGF